jgi:acyl transferase domain-containing protein/acyl carrier protein
LQSNPAFMALLGYLQVYIGNDKDYLTTRVSYKLNLRGPSFSIQTACSTSLVAVAVACGDLIDHKCDMALAGGVSVRVPQGTGYYFEPGGIFSPDGHCRVFDKQGQGIVFSNGVGIVVLKRLEDAIADRDSIYAVVKGWAVNNDGSAKASFTAPGIEGQAEVISLAQQRARVDPDTITYIEAHGTGTPLGDPVEIAALTRAFRAHTQRKQFCAVGSVKTNIGHLDPAAGAASLIKTALALQHRQIPASLNCETPSPAIDFTNSPFYVNTRLSEWKTDHQPRRAGVSAFGIGGTNVHVVLEQAPPPRPRRGHARRHQLLVLSARSRAALDSVAANLLEHLGRNEDLRPDDVAYTCQIGRKSFNHRFAVVFQDRADLMSALKGRDPSRLLTTVQTPRPRSVAFIFSGQGSQYVGMARDLYQAEPTFRAHLDRCSLLLKPHIALDLRHVIHSAEDTEAAREKLTQTRIAQPALFSVEYALAQLWMEWGIHPQAMIGHSLGEFVAACLAGVFSLEDALALVAERGRLMQSLPRGSMLAVPLPEPDLRRSLDGRLDVAAINEAGSCVVSGPTKAIEQLRKRLAGQGIECQRLRTSHAFHSSMMEPVLRAFAARIASTALGAPRIPYLSNVTGDWITAAEATSAEYWARHIRQPVLFAQGLAGLLKEQDRILLEVGPGQSLSAFARRHPDKNAGHLVLSSMRHAQNPTPDSAFILSTLARLWICGAQVDWPRFRRYERASRVHLPGYPFERQRYWAEIADDAAEPVILKEPNIGDWFYVPSWEYAISPEPSDLGTKISCWLLFEDEHGIVRGMSNRLRRAGHDVVVIRRGEQFARHDPDCVEIDPAERDHYLMLFNALLDSNRIPDKIIHAWSLGSVQGKRTEMELFDYYQNVGFFSLLYIAQALIKVKASKPIQIVAVSENIHRVTGVEQLYPGKATLLGACKSIPQEFPNITCRNVDMDLQLSSERILEEAAAELMAVCCEDMPHTVLAYRGGQRWVQTFEPLLLEESAEAISPLRQSGVYLITGGLGNIGLTLSEYLASNFQAKLVLLTRSEFPRKQDWKVWLKTHPPTDHTCIKIRRLQGIEKSGSEVLILSADVANVLQMKRAVERSYARFGRLNGVIHGAGNVGANGFFGVDQADPALCELQFQSKVRGLIVLEQVIRRKNLDFVVLLSSVSSVLAGLGYVAYSAANTFMDAFAHKFSQKSGLPWISIDWDTWDLDQDPDRKADPARLEMTAAEGLDAFWRILSGALLPQIVVSTGNLWTRIHQWIDPSHLRDARDAENRRSALMHSRPELANPYTAPGSSVELAIAEIWQETLGIERVGIFDNFFLDLSGSSLLATQVASRMRSKFQVELPLRRFFEGPTIAELAAAINAQRPDEHRVLPTEGAGAASANNGSRPVLTGTA